MKPNNRVIEFIMDTLKDKGRAVAIILVYLICLLTLLPVTSDALIFGDDSRDDPVCFSNAIQHYARAVAKFDRGESGELPATAFLISPDNLVLTAAHAIPPRYFFGKLTFNLQAVTCGGDLTTSTEVPLEWDDVVKDANDNAVINRDLDYVLFRLPDGYDPAIQGGHRWLRLDPDTKLKDLPDDQKGLYIIGYQIDRSKITVALDQQCKIKGAQETCQHLIDELDLNPPDNACLSEQCDVLHGYSGGPVIRYGPYGSGGVVALVSGAKGDNLDVKIRRIYRDIQEKTDGMLTGIYDDTDGDGMPDCRDNCPDVPNAGRCSQGKEPFVICICDRDCDTAFDAGDGVCEGSQVDSDNDGVGDACATLPADQFEDNDTPLTAAEVLDLGNYHLSLDNAFDEDFYLVNVQADDSDLKIHISWNRSDITKVTALAEYWDCEGPGCPHIQVSPYKCSGELGQGDVFCELMTLTDDGLVFEQKNIPAGRTYLFHVYEWWTENRGRRPMEYDMFVSGSFAGTGELPADRYEVVEGGRPGNDYYDLATEWDTSQACDYSGELTIHNNSDVDWYKVDALGHAVEAELTFDSTYGDLQLYLCDVSTTCTAATDVSVSDTTITRRITGCGTLPTYVKVEGYQNHYNLCIRKVDAQQGCGQFQLWTHFVGSGTFDYTRTIPGSFGMPDTVVQGTATVRDRMYVNLAEETDTYARWLIVGWIDYEYGSQLFQGTLQIPKPNTSPVPFSTYIYGAPGLPSWWQDENYGGSGQGTFTGVDNAIESFDVTSSGLIWSELYPDEHGTLTVQGLIDSDGDGLSNELELATGTDPYSDDTDGDGLTDGMGGTEDADGDGQVDYLTGETDPREWDTDGDGLPDGLERGLTHPQGNDTDLSRFVADSDPTTTTDPTRLDTDRDGRSDAEEDANGNGRVDPGETSPIVPDAAPPTVWNISGGAYNYPEGGRYRASFSMDITTGDPSPSGWLKYYYTRTRMNFVSTGITEASVSGTTATISGTGSVNGVEGYTFTATVTNGDPDSFGITIQDTGGNTYYTAGPGDISGGDLEITLQ